jgi:hypothetical protein
MCAHYHCAPRPCRPARGNEKGRVERAIRYVRDSFFAARHFTTLADFNHQARRWRDEIAHQRRWPGDDSCTVAEAFEEERPRLLPLPSHPFDTDSMLAVHTDKIIYVRFDLNDYSIPPSAVGHTLTLIASDIEVRVLDGSCEIARHRRSYDRHERITDPKHEEALLEDKRKAMGNTRHGRLLGAAPEAEALLDAAFQHGEPVGSQTAQLLRLLDDYGADELRAAVHEALERQTPRASSVAFILCRRHRTQRRRAPLPVNLTRRPDLVDLHVKPHDLETYDELTHSDPDQ